VFKNDGGFTSRLVLRCLVVVVKVQVNDDECRLRGTNTNNIQNKEIHLE
jgi:hypothetical protein